MQKAIQQNARKPANHLRGYRTEVLGKISGVKFEPKLRPNQRANFDAKLAPIAGASYALRPDGAENFTRGGFSTKFCVETGKMNTAARRNRFYANRHSERMKWDPF